jgi:hypothetical protein
MEFKDKTIRACMTGGDSKDGVVLIIENKFEEVERITLSPEKALQFALEIIKLAKVQGA